MHFEQCLPIATALEKELERLDIDSLLIVVRFWRDHTNTARDIEKIHHYK